MFGLVRFAVWFLVASIGFAIDDEECKAAEGCKPHTLVCYGPRGPRGCRGPIGPRGPQGLMGPKGPNGIPSEVTDQVIFYGWVNNVFPTQTNSTYRAYRYTNGFSVNGAFNEVIIAQAGMYVAYIYFNAQSFDFDLNVNGVPMLPAQGYDTTGDQFYVTYIFFASPAAIVTIYNPSATISSTSSQSALMSIVIQQVVANNVKADMRVWKRRD